MKTNPTIGRVMLYFPAQGSSHLTADGEALTAHVAKVNEDGTVNIAYHDQDGNTHAAQNISVVQDDEPTHAEGYVTWMPYQVSQHAKNQAIANAEKLA